MAGGYFALVFLGLLNMAMTLPPYTLLWFCPWLRAVPRTASRPSNFRFDLFLGERGHLMNTKPFEGARDSRSFSPVRSFHFG
ncbi:hypothetical protein BGW80DRAFT_1356827 [Lactifluus volemus]|nr:hypothetical protein BGW80DRAFT_1356827 [Lactifluus volemus]